MENFTLSEIASFLSKELNNIIDFYIKKLENNEKLTDKDLYIISKLLDLLRTS